MNWNNPAEKKDHLWRSSLKIISKQLTMRFNEKELVFLSRQPSERAAELGMKGPKKGDVMKRRLVKLIVNFLFYFRTYEEEPIGALLLEQCRVEREDDLTFSITFLDEAERKYLFECNSREQRIEWMDAIIKASYEFMRKNLFFYRSEIHRLTGKDPLEQYGISDETRFQVSNALPPPPP